MVDRRVQGILGALVLGLLFAPLTGDPSAPLSRSGWQGSLPPSPTPRRQQPSPTRTLDATATARAFLTLLAAQRTATPTIGATSTPAPTLAVTRVTATPAETATAGPSPTITPSPTEGPSPTPTSTPEPVHLNPAVTTLDQLPLLTPEQPVATGVLNGGGLTNAVYYRWVAPAPGMAVTVTLGFTPGDPDLLEGIVLTVFGPDRVALATMRPRDLGPTGNAAGPYYRPRVGQASVLVPQAIPGTYVIELQNNALRAATYSLLAANLQTPPPAAAPAPVPPTEPASAQMLATTGGRVEGDLGGDGRPNVALYVVAQPGGENLHVRLEFWPADPGMIGSVGLNLYRPDGTLVDANKPHREGNHGVVEVRVPRTAGTYLVQVWNYVSPPKAVHYILTTP